MTKRRCNMNNDQFLKVGSKVICPITTELFDPNTFSSLGTVLKGEIGIITDFGYKLHNNIAVLAIKVEFKVGICVFTKSMENTATDHDNISTLEIVEETNNV